MYIPVLPNTRYQNFGDANDFTRIMAHEHLLSLHEKLVADSKYPALDSRHFQICRHDNALRFNTLPEIISDLIRMVDY